MKKIFFTTAATLLLLAGCEQERMPEPNAATCAPDAFQAALNEMRSEARGLYRGMQSIPEGQADASVGVQAQP